MYAHACVCACVFICVCVSVVGVHTLILKRGTRATSCTGTQQRPTADGQDPVCPQHGDKGIGDRHWGQATGPGEAAWGGRGLAGSVRKALCVPTSYLTSRVSISSSVK